LKRKFKPPKYRNFIGHNHFFFCTPLHPSLFNTLCMYISKTNTVLVTNTYYNPCLYKDRVKNYQLFRILYSIRIFSAIRILYVFIYYQVVIVLYNISGSRTGSYCTEFVEFAVWCVLYRNRGIRSLVYCTVIVEFAVVSRICRCIFALGRISMCSRGWWNTQALVRSRSVSVYLFLCGGGEDSRSVLLWSVKILCKSFLVTKKVLFSSRVCK
jgi:hypothetical protein